MLKKIICFIFIIKLATVCDSFVPKFVGSDGAFILDADKTLVRKTKFNDFKFPARMSIPPPFPLWRHYPRYHIIPPPHPGQILAINIWPKATKKTLSFIPTSTTTTTTTTTPKPTTSTSTVSTPPIFLVDEEFPSELLDIAHNKLGLRGLDEIPSISELGQLLGTDTREKTLEYMKKLSSNDQGIALMKAYIESADYTDKTGDLGNNNENSKIEDENEPEVDEDEEDANADESDDRFKMNDESLVVITDEDSEDDNEIKYDESNLKETQDLHESNNNSLIERLANYMHLNNLFNKEEESKQNDNFDEVNRITENGKKINNFKEIQKVESEPKNISKTPILVRESIPFNYPIPIRIINSTTSTPQRSVSESNVVHLNTPKVLIPHMQQISRVTKIPVKQIEDFMDSKPKLLELVTKVSRFPIGYDRNSPIEAQVLAAVKKAFEEDEDLKKLLSATATLK